jgi:hypothetical protein
MHLFQIVCCENNGVTRFLQFDNLVDHQPGCQIVQVGQWFVHQQNLWLHGQHTGNGKASFFTPGKKVGPFIFIPGQIHCRQRPGDPVQDLIMAQSKVFRAEGRIVRYGFADDLAVGVLKHHPHLLAGRHGILFHGFSTNAYRSPKKGKASRSNGAKGRLSGPVGTGNDGELPLVERKGNVFECLRAIGIRMAKIFSFNDAHNLSGIRSQG